MEPNTLQHALRPGDVPELVLAEDLVLRRWQPGDREARYQAIVASFEHLHPWMEWATEPPTEQEDRERFERAMRWPSGSSYNFGIFGGPEPAILGMAAVHDELGPGAVEIGYWCHAAHVGQGVITKSVGALTHLLLGLAHVDRVEIHCDEANKRSAAVARRLDYRLDRMEEDGVNAPAESGRGMIWVKERDSQVGR
jgi:RimJ/RimL family protein N-acetyltransferase